MSTERDELILVARLRALEETQDGRVIRALLDRLAQQGLSMNAHPDCDCGAKGPPPHKPPCRSLLTLEDHSRASGHEWQRAAHLATALRMLMDAVRARPSMTIDLAATLDVAAKALSDHGHSDYPGADGLPF